MSSSNNRPTVLVVDDHEPLANLYTRWLATDYDVRTAYGGAEALDLIDATVDVVLLDRRMPDLTGDATLEEIRSTDADCLVAMVTAAKPDSAVLDLDCDAYVTKPVTRADLVETVETLVARKGYDATHRAYFALLSKRAVLATVDDGAGNDLSAELTRVRERLDTLEADLDATVADLSERERRAVFRSDEDPRSRHVAREGPDRSGGERR